MKALEIRHLDGGTGLRLAGELDLQTAPRLTEAFETLRSDGPVRLDLTQVTFIDSSGLHAIVKFARGVNGNGPLILEGASGITRQVFEITNIGNHPNIEIR